MSFVGFPEVAVDVVDVESAQGDAAHYFKGIRLDADSGAIRRSGGTLVGDGQVADFPILDIADQEGCGETAFAINQRKIALTITADSDR